MHNIIKLVETGLHKLFGAVLDEVIQGKNVEVVSAGISMQTVGQS